MYLGMKIKCMQLHNVIWAWSMSPSVYIQEAVRMCENYVAEHLSKGYKLPMWEENPFDIGNSPELHMFTVLGPDERSYYHSLLGVMKWMIKIGQININTRYHHIQQCQDRGIWRQCFILWVV